eukprot:CAMPEP_0172509102 /NCGR_PEP_ID=MMETSP1066-20121228/217543_1 /TAXON_ID=671091 /ORGANISM="Coscinodiscus wailesii, Strain CCMP2513" /LENGTH=448 /DNA_ID=CAMNT_0013287431 /DNA_START=15 /DNA_END=1361 /DNA_ORIENTATION=+
MTNTQNTESSYTNGNNSTMNETPKTEKKSGGCTATIIPASFSRGLMFTAITLTVTLLLLSSRTNTGTPGHSIHLRNLSSTWNDWIDQAALAKKTKTQLGTREFSSLDGTYPGGGFGHSISTSNKGFLVVGAPAGGENGEGSVHVYRNNGRYEPIGNAPLQGVKPGDGFGSVVDISPNNQLFGVGAPNAGYISMFSIRSNKYFDKAGSYEGAQAGDRFGYSLSLDQNGNHMVVGAPGTDEIAGYIRLYTYSLSTYKWRKSGDDFRGYGNSVADDFGAAVSMSPDGETIAVGNPAAGLVQIYQVFSGNPRKKGKDIRGSADERFGASLDVTDEGEYVVIGTGSGNSVAVYEWKGNAYDQYATTVYGDKGFGFSVSTSKDNAYLVVGNPSSGISSLYYETQGNIHNYGTLGGNKVDKSGYSVSMQNNGYYFAVGAPGGKGGDGNVKVYTRN